ncbi:hypothetical protein [Gemmatimonas sp.]|uniref:hypothetical protein n=1 Tax=Gemmatimonas sp. TaxID=1962908 RepID=UPI00333F9327
MRYFALALFVFVGCVENQPRKVRTFRDLGAALWADSSGAAIGDGDVLDAMLLDSLVVMLSPDLGNVRAVSANSGQLKWVAGRKGAGPAEFASPTTLLWMTPERFAVIDPRQGRVSILASDGRFLSSISGDATSIDLHNTCYTRTGRLLGVDLARSRVIQWSMEGSVVASDSIVWPDKEMNEVFIYRQGYFARSRGSTCVLISLRGNYFLALDSASFRGAKYMPYFERYSYAPVTGYRNGYAIVNDAGASADGSAVDGKNLFVLHVGSGSLKSRVVDVYDVSTGQYEYSIKLERPAFSVDVAGGKMMVLERSDLGIRVSVHPLPGSASTTQ